MKIKDLRICNHIKHNDKLCRIYKLDNLKMKLHKKEKEYKKSLKLLDERNHLLELKRNQPLIKLDEPFHNGWNVSIRLRDDILRRSDALDILSAIKYGYKSENTVWKKKHVKAIRRGVEYYTTWSNYLNSYIKISYYPGKIEYKEKDFTEKVPDNLHKYFRLKPKRNRKGYVYAHVYIIDLPKYYTQLRVRKRLVTHISAHNPDIQSRLDEIDEIFEQRLYWKLLYGKVKYWDEDYNYNRAKNKEITNKIINNELDDQA